MRLIRCNYCGIELDVEHPSWVMANLHLYDATTKMTRVHEIDVCAECQQVFYKEVERWLLHIGQERTRV